MKRLVLIVLALSLLCGCSVIKQEPTLPDESIMTEPTTQPVAIEPTEPPYDKEVLEGGVWVQTDYSKYAPDELTPKYTRLSQEHIPALQPSNDYGLIYPFIGSRNDSDWGNLERFGMMDASGCVIADAVYSDIDLICATTQERNGLMWCLSKTEPNDDGYPETKNALAGLDGSFVSEHIYTSVSAYEEYVLARIYEDDHTIVHVYDAQGNLCLNSEDLPFHDRLIGYADFKYGGGLFVVELDDSSEYYITDWSGNLLYGPFDYAESFSDGYALVKKNNECYVYLDKNGNEWMDKEFTYAESFYRGYAAASDDTGRQFLLSAKDGVVVSVYADSSYWNGDYFSITTLTSSGWKNQAYNTEGDLLHEWSDDDYCELIGSSDLLCNYAEGKITNLKTGEERLLGDIDEYYVDSYLYVDSFAPIPYFYVHYYVSNKVILFDKSLNEVLSATGYFDIAEDSFRKKNYIVSVDGKTQIYDMNAEPILTLPFTDCEIYNGMVLCYDNAASYYYDLDGNLIFCYPYDGIAGD